MSARMSTWPYRYAPLLLFALTYVLSCVVGAVLMLVGYDAFTALFEYFSGTDVPSLAGDELAVTLTLLLVAPVVLGIGYAAGLRLPLARPARADGGSSRPELEAPRWLPHAVFYLLAVVALVSIFRAGALEDVGSWLDYGAWVSARSNVLERIGFAGFVNIYLLVPLAAAWVLISGPGRSLLSLRAIPCLAPTVIVVALELLLYMRKAAIVAVLVILFAFLIDTLRRRRRAGVPILVGTAAIALIYFAAVVVPVYADTSRTVEQAIEEKPPAAGPLAPSGGGAHEPAPPSPEVAASQEERLVELGSQLQFETRREAIVLYSLISPLTRTSAPALYYPVVYPDEHPFHPIDLGQDVLGFGAMPDDNVVVWRYMNPTIPGTTTAPFQFVLYSQGGLPVALLGSALAGLLLALLWRLVRSPGLGSTWSALLGSMVLLLGVYLAIDSPRNSTLVSYGVVWGFLFVLGAVALTVAVNRAGGQRATRALIPTNQPSRAGRTSTSGPPTLRS